MNDRHIAAIRADVEMIRQQLKVNIDYFDSISDKELLKTLQGHIHDRLANIETRVSLMEMADDVG